MCMASSCEVLVDTQDPSLFNPVFEIVKNEAMRIEQKFSRYRNDNIVFKINNSANTFVAVDTETAQLLDFAKNCYELSDGLFDITSGSLRKLWNFKNFSEFPEPEKIKAALEDVGFDKLKWESPHIKLKKGMEIDFGGIAKEYAVDRCLQLALTKTKKPFLINFGGDLAINQAPQQGSWAVAIEEAFKKNLPNQLSLKQGALATSGDTHRFFIHQGKRFSHILNPKTGLPVSNNIASVTVHAPTCTMAGLLATISHLQPDPAEFLKAQGVPHWIVPYDAAPLT